MRYHFLLAMAILFAGASPLAFASESEGPALEGLGGGLLDDDLLEELMKDPPPVDRPPATPNIDGEDIGPKESPLQKIERGMQNAGKLIRSQDVTGETREVQQGIITELDNLIDKLNKQCQKCSGGQCNNSGKQQTQKQTPKSGEGSGSQASSAAQSGSSESQVAESKEPKDNDDSPQQASGSQLAKQLWGQLPERMRQQLLQSSADEFLPKYRKQLEQYYRRLAEEQAKPTR